MPQANRILMGAARAGVAALGLIAAAAYADDSTAASAAVSADSADLQPTVPRSRSGERTQSVTVLEGSDLDNRRITTLADIASGVPEIAAAPSLSSLSTLSLYMRGEGPTAAGDVTLDGAVGIYEDGFYVARAQAITFDLLDLERVEVLAGPQGATYGRDTTGGVINLVSQSPTGHFGFDESVDFGNRNSYRVLGSIDTPRWYGLSAKVTGVVSGIDGYVKNELASQHDFGADKQRAARLQLLWDGLAQLRARYFIERSGLDSTPEYDTDPERNGQEVFPGFTYYANPRGPATTTYRPIYLPLSISNHTAHGLTLTWQPLSALTVESHTGYRTLSSTELQDYAELFGFPEQTTDAYREHQFTQDLHLSGELFSQQFGYRLGATYFREINVHQDYLNFFENGESDLRLMSAATRSQALFAQLHWQPDVLGHRLDVSAAGRYTKESKDATRKIIFDQSSVLESDGLSHISYGRANPEAALSWRWTEALSTYAKVATAFESGGALETAPPGTLASNTYRPESSTTYELGLKAESPDHRLAADLAVFDSRRKDVQVVLPMEFDGDAVFEFQSVTVRGATFDVHAAPLSDLSVSAGGTWLNATIDKADALAGTLFDPAVSGGPYVVGENIKHVFSLPYTPRYSASLAGDYTFLHLDRRDLMLHLDYVYRARMFASAGSGPAVPGSQFDTQPAYGLLNGRLTLSQETDWSHRLKFSLWGRNLLKRKYYQPAVGEGAGVTALDSSGSGPAGYTSRAGAWAEPMTYGINATYRY